MDYANRCPKRKHMQRYHSGRTRCQVNQEVASTDAPTPRIDSLQATPSMSSCQVTNSSATRVRRLRHRCCYARTWDEPANKAYEPQSPMKGHKSSP